MKRNFFGDPVFQPGDDNVADTFFEEFGTEPADVVLNAVFLEEDPEFNWSCEIQDQDGNSLQVHDFTSEAALRAWLRSEHISVD